MSPNLANKKQMRLFCAVDCCEMDLTLMGTTLLVSNVSKYIRNLKNGILLAWQLHFQELDLRKRILNRKKVCLQTWYAFPCGSAGKESTHNARDLDSVPGMGRSPREQKGYPLRYSGLENSMDYTVHGVTKSQTQLSDFHFRFHKDGH